MASALRPVAAHRQGHGSPWPAYAVDPARRLLCAPIADARPLDLSQIPCMIAAAPRPGRPASMRLFEQGNRPKGGGCRGGRSEEHTSELQSLMRISYAVFGLQKKTHKT